MIQPRRHGQWQRFVDSFDHEVSVKTTCHPLPVAFLVVGTLTIALVFHYVPLAREAIGLRDWVLPSTLVAVGGAISIFGWWRYPDRNLVAFTQFVDVSLYGAGTIAFSALTQGLASYVFACAWMLACYSWGTHFALTLLGMVSCFAGPVVVALVLDVPPLVWVSMFVSASIYIFAARTTTARHKQVARYARSGEVLERIDQLLEGRSSEVARAVQSHTTSLLHEAKNELTPASWNLDLVANRDDLTDQERQALVESKASIDETLAAIQTILEKTPAEVEEDATLWLPDLAGVIAREGHDPAEGILTVEAMPEVTVRCPVEYLSIALRNLLDNAVEAGAQRIALSGSLAGGGSSVVLTLGDDGPGLPDQVQDKLFKPFNTHGKDRGVGLGIYLSKRMIDAAGGELRLASTGPEGTIFEIELPTGGTR